MRITTYLMYCCLFFFSAQVLSQESTTITEDSVSIGKEGSRIFGSMIMPDDNPLNVVALIIAGSGPTDRNGNNPGHNRYPGQSRGC